MPCEGNFVHIQFNLDGISLPEVDMSSEELDILRGFVEDDDALSAFVNPMGSKLDSITTKIDAAIEDADDQNLKSKLNDFKVQVASFKTHTDRLSGVVGGEGGLPDISGVAGMASSFAAAKSMLAGPGAAVEDNFSQMFGSISGGGSIVVDEAIDIMNIVANTSNISEAENMLDTAINGLCVAESNDIDRYTEAEEYINKLNVGRRIISMNQSTDFNKVIGELVTKPDLQVSIQNIPKPEIPNIDDVTSGFKFPEIPNLPEIPEL